MLTRPEEAWRSSTASQSDLLKLQGECGAVPVQDCLQWGRKGYCFGHRRVQWPVREGQPCGLDTELLTVPRYNSSHQSLRAGKAASSSSMRLARHPPLPIMPRVLHHSQMVQRAREDTRLQEEESSPPCGAVAGFPLPASSPPPSARSSRQRSQRGWREKWLPQPPFPSQTST